MFDDLQWIQGLEGNEEERLQIFGEARAVFRWHETPTGTTCLACQGQGPAARPFLFGQRFG